LGEEKERLSQLGKATIPLVVNIVIHGIDQVNNGGIQENTVGFPVRVQSEVIFFCRKHCTVSILVRVSQDILEKLLTFSPLPSRLLITDMRKRMTVVVIVGVKMPAFAQGSAWCWHAQ
jgi:hypothetical protein